MKKFIASFFLVFFISSGGLLAQSRATVEAYINTYKEMAMQEMLRTGVPASITLAQGIHETGAGTSDLVIKSNNHFGIKCKSEWTGDRVYHDDDARGECFRKYDDPLLSYRDHSDFLKNRPNYTALFKLDPTDYEAWAFGLKKAGYATNPKYPQILIGLIRDYNLQDYSLIALGKKSQEANSSDWTKKESDIEVEAVVAAPAVFYPEGTFTINDTKVMYITKGTSYLKIAEEKDIPLARLFDFNDLTNGGDVAAKDGLFFLQRKRKTGAAAFHTVLRGESLYDISQAEGIRLESLLQYNFLTPGVQVAAGEKLYLAASAPSMPQLASASQMIAKAEYKEEPLSELSEEPVFTVHVVQPKETVYSIAKKYEVTIEDIKKWNGFATNDLQIGQQVRIKQTDK